MSQTLLFLFHTNVCQNIILKISVPIRIHANCKQEVPSYIIKDELYSKFANFFQMNNVEIVAANSFEKFLSSCFPLLSIGKKLIKCKSMCPSQNHFVQIQTFHGCFGMHLALFIVFFNLNPTMCSIKINVKRKAIKLTFLHGARLENHP